MDTNANLLPAPDRPATGAHQQWSARPAVFGRPDSTLPAHRCLSRVLKLLSAVNIRLSLFAFEAATDEIDTASLYSAVEAAVDDTGLAFELNDGRVGALVYGGRPPRAEDSWVEDRTLAQLDWVFGGPFSSLQLVDVQAVHRCSSELSEGNDVVAALASATEVPRTRYIGVA